MTGFSENQDLTNEMIDFDVSETSSTFNMSEDSEDEREDERHAGFPMTAQNDIHEGGPELTAPIQETTVPSDGRDDAGPEEASERNPLEQMPPDPNVTGTRTRRSRGWFSFTSRTRVSSSPNEQKPPTRSSWFTRKRRSSAEVPTTAEGNDPMFNGIVPDPESPPQGRWAVHVQAVNEEVEGAVITMPIPSKRSMKKSLGERLWGRSKVAPEH